MLVPHSGEFIFNPGSCCQLESSNTNVLYTVQLWAHQDHGTKSPQQPGGISRRTAGLDAANGITKASFYIKGGNRPSWQLDGAQLQFSVHRRWFFPSLII